MNQDENLLFIILQDLIRKKFAWPLWYHERTLIAHRDYLYQFVNTTMGCYQQIHVVRFLNRIFSYLSLFFFRSPVIVKNKNYYWKINVILIEFSKNHLSDNQSIQIQYLALPYQTIFNQMPESLPKNTLGRKWIVGSYLDDKVCMYSILTSSVFV